MKYCLRLVFIGVLLMGSSRLSAQNLKELYVSRLQDNGTLYHIFPLTLFESAGNGDLVFDLTYLQYGDSITVNFTYFQKAATELDSVRFESKGSAFGGKVNKLYIEADKLQKWTHRYSLRCPVDPLFSFFHPGFTSRVLLYTKGKSIEYDSKKAAWQKLAPRVNAVLNSIRLKSNK